MSSTSSAGRPIEFQPDEALESVMRLFWKHGFEKTSMSDLESFTGLGRASLYNTFGSKHELYLKALERYLERLGEMMFFPLENGQSGLQDVHDFLERLRHGLARGLGVPVSTRGCMMINGMVESGGTDPALALLGEEFSRRFLTSMGEALRRAASLGQIPESGLETKARLLLAIALGVNVTSRSGAPREEIGALVDAAHDLVRAWKTEHAGEATAR